jgi:hypothetical protein
MDPALKALLNSLRCPICKSLIDGGKVAAYCVANRDHYDIRIVSDSGSPLWIAVPPKIVIESVRVYDKKHKYDIFQSYSCTINNSFITNDSTIVTIWDIDAEGRVLYNLEKNPSLSYSKKLFDFQKTNREKIFNRIKTLLVFQ